MRALGIIPGGGVAQFGEQAVAATIWLMRGFEQRLIDRLLLPVVAVGKLLDRMPTVKDIQVRWLCRSMRPGAMTP